MRELDTDSLTHCDGLPTCSLGVDICKAVHASLEPQVTGSLQSALWRRQGGGLRRLEGQIKLFSSQVLMTGYLPTFLRYMAAVRVSPTAAGDLFLEEDLTSWSSD